MVLAARLCSAQPPASHQQTTSLPTRTRPSCCIVASLHRRVQTTQPAQPLLLLLLLLLPLPPRPPPRLQSACDQPPRTRRKPAGAQYSARPHPLQPFPSQHPHSPRPRPQQNTTSRGAWFPIQTLRVPSARCPYGARPLSHRIPLARQLSADIARPGPISGARRLCRKMSFPSSPTPATLKSSSAMDARNSAICCTS